MTHHVTMPTDKALEYLGALKDYANAKFPDPGFAIALSMAIGGMSRAAELVKAEKEGRCKIPSCGETVFVLTDSCWWTANLKVEEIIECRVKTHRLTKKGEVKFSVDGIWKSGHPYKASFGATSIGKTVFLTRAEAEAALGGGENG